eukprot:scpid6292/ scgid10613/ 
MSTPKTRLICRQCISKNQACIQNRLLNKTLRYLKQKLQAIQNLAGTTKHKQGPGTAPCVLCNSSNPHKWPVGAGRHVACTSVNVTLRVESAAFAICFSLAEPDRKRTWNKFLGRSVVLSNRLCSMPMLCRTVAAHKRGTNATGCT